MKYLIFVLASRKRRSMFKSSTIHMILIFLISFPLIALTIGCSNTTPTAIEEQVASEEQAPASDDGSPSAGRCWRAGRRCINLILNGDVDPAPSNVTTRSQAIDLGYEPIVGPWVYGSTLGNDRSGNSQSRSILFNAGSSANATNDEYLRDFHPKYTAGRYRFSFWFKEDADSQSSNDWSIEFKVRDWWGTQRDTEEMTPMGWIPDGATNCYGAVKMIYRPPDAQASVWNNYSVEFQVPLIDSDWDGLEQMNSCRNSSNEEIPPYPRTQIIPGGYAIVIRLTSIKGQDVNVIGRLQFDDFSIERINE